MRLCRSCYAANKRVEMEDLKDELESWKWECRFLREKLNAVTQPPQQIPDDMLRRLIMLCHPDRHGDSDASTVATRWLLAQRGRRP